MTYMYYEPPMLNECVKRSYPLISCGKIGAKKAQTQLKLPYHYKLSVASQIYLHEMSNRMR